MDGYLEQREYVGMRDALGGCTIIAFAYVFSLYLIPSHIRAKGRDDAVHIRYRMWASSTATALCAVGVVAYLYAYDVPKESFTIMQSLGLRLDTLVGAIVRTAVLMSFFYAGPLLTHLCTLYNIGYSDIDYEGRTLVRKDAGLATSSLRDASRARLDFLKDLWGALAAEDPLILYRNLVFAPVTEELAFRALMLPLLHPTFTCALGWSTEEVAMLNPIFFSLAHLHHVYEKLRSGQSVKMALLSTLLQASYTGIFGFVAALLFLRTGNLASPLTAHVICNFMGLPDVGFFFPPGHPNSSRLSFLHPYRHFHCFVHIFGLFLFWHSLIEMLFPFAIDNPFLECKSIYLKYL